MSGAFITIEGLEGVGKSTCLSIIQDKLSKQGYEVLITREPGGTELGEKLREWILSGEPGSLSATTEVLLMFAARSHHLEKVIRPALDKGQWVICDRFTDATFAYQGGGKGASSQWLENLKKSVQRDLEPDLTFLLDAPAEVGLARISNRKADYFEREDKAFYRRVRDVYLKLAIAQPARVKVINAAGSINEVNQELVIALNKFLLQHATLS
jgi:dTMP kinase|tara:strand:- start:523 stop:1158 length:636 start_codon:yes stop_codon:yes gene_type:complete